MSLPDRSTLLSDQCAGNDKDEQSEEEEFVLPQFIGITLDVTKKRLREFPSELLNQAEFVQVRIKLKPL